jgi:hypothetical protein
VARYGEGLLFTSADSRNNIIQTTMAAVFGLFGMVTLISLGFPHWCKRCLSAFAILFAAILAWWLMISPLSERRWQPDVAKLAYAMFEDNNVTVHNIRNFDYRSEFDYQPGYYSKTYDLNKLEGVDLIAIYWIGPVQKGIAPCIPPKEIRKIPIAYDKTSTSRAIRSRTCSENSRTGGASPCAMIAVPIPSSPPFLSPQPSSLLLN